MPKEIPDVLHLFEEKLNSWANDIAPQYRIEQGSFRIKVKQQEAPKPTRYGYLVQDGSYHDWMMGEDHSVIRPKKTYLVHPRDYIHSRSQLLATVHNGPTVQITVYIPFIDKGDIKNNFVETVKRMKRTIRGLFKYISNPRLHRDSDLFNPLIVGDVLHEYIQSDSNTRVWKKKRFNPNVIEGHHRDEFKVNMERRVTFKHRETGMEYTVIDETGKRSEWDLYQEAFERCVELIVAREREIARAREQEDMNRNLPVPMYLNPQNFKNLTVQ